MGKSTTAKAGRFPGNCVRAATKPPCSGNSGSKMAQVDRAATVEPGAGSTSVSMTEPCRDRKSLPRQVSGVAPCRERIDKPQSRPSRMTSKTLTGRFLSRQNSESQSQQDQCEHPGQAVVGVSAAVPASDKNAAMEEGKVTESQPAAGMIP